MANDIEPTPEQKLYRPYFEKVQATSHWKDPIDAFVYSDDIILTAQAIRFYTVTEPVLERTHNPKWFRIKAAGYRQGPAGDH